MGFKDYSDAFKTPVPGFPRTEVSLDKLMAVWEKLRELDTAGYRTSQGVIKSAFLVRIECADGQLGKSQGNGVTCSPFTAQALLMALSEGGPPYKPVFSDGTPVPKLLSNCANGNLKSTHKGLKKYGLDPKRDNGWARSCIAFNLAEAIHPTEMRRGDAVSIDWTTGGGHAVYCWDVHLDENSKVSTRSNTSRPKASSIPTRSGATDGACPSAAASSTSRRCPPIRTPASRATRC